MFGFRKADVNAYIEKILGEFDSKLKEKDDELASVKAQNRDIKTKHDELLKKADQINEDRAKIADVLIKAQEKAEQLLDDARSEALAEKKRLEEDIEREREKLVDIKQDVKRMRSEVAETLKRYDSQLVELVRDEE
jgi:cell division initiation protein